MIEFKYKEQLKIDSTGIPFIVKRPNAVVTVSNKGQSYTLDMLVDSGADISIIPKVTGESLGLEIKSEKEIETIGGIGGSIPIVIREIDLKIGSEEFSAKIGWSLEEDIIPILGREDIFDRFHIEFLQDIETVRFHKVK